MTEQEMIARRQFALRIMKLIGAVEEETGESAFSLELIVEGELVPASLIRPLPKETGELVAITASSRKTAASALARSQIANRKSQIH